MINLTFLLDMENYFSYISIYSNYNSEDKMDSAIKEQLIVAGYNTIFILALVIGIGLLLNTFKMKILDLLCKLFGKKVGEFMVNRLTFIGVIHHELSHAFMALICGAQVTEVSIFKFKGDTLGNVKFISRGPKMFRDLQMCFAALAPAICGISTLYLMSYFINMRCDLVWWEWIILIYIELSVLLHMTLSKVDIKAAFRGMFTTLTIIYIIFFFTKFNFVIELTEMVKSFKIKV